jgi:zinc-ribbon domain
MPYCENCGKPVNETAKFCRNCGAPQNPQTQATTAPQVVPAPVTGQPKPQAPQVQTQTQEAQEQIQSFIIVNRSKRFVSQEYLTGIITSRRLIFAPMTKDIIKEVTNITRQQAKDKTGPINAYPYQQNYLAIPPQVIINQSPDSLAIENVSIRQIKLELVSTGGDGYADNTEFEMKVIADSGSYTFRMTKRDEYVTRLNNAYHDKLILPKSYILKQ